MTLGKKSNNSPRLYNPRSYINFGASNQRNIGLDRNSLKFDFPNLDISISRKVNINSAPKPKRRYFLKCKMGMIL